MINFELNTKYKIDFTNNFKKQLRKMLKQRYKNHQLTNDKTYKNCYECHIRPDWLLIYKYEDNNLVLVLFATGTHSEFF